jgi:hypothetical protein
MIDRSPCGTGTCAVMAERRPRPLRDWLGSHRPHLRPDWAHPRPHLRQDWLGCDGGHAATAAIH